MKQTESARVARRLANKLGLTPMSVELYAMICDTTPPGGWFCMNGSEIAEKVGCSTTTVYKLLRILTERGLLKKRVFRDYGMACSMYQLADLQEMEVPHD